MPGIESLGNLAGEVNSNDNESRGIRINRGEKILTREDVVQELKYEFDKNESKAIKAVSDYSLTKKAEFEKENPDTAEINLALHLADIYFDAGIVDMALTNIASAREQAKHLRNEKLVEEADKSIDEVVENMRR